VAIILKPEITKSNGILKCNSNILFGNAVIAALLSERKYDVMPQNGVLRFFETKSVIKMQRRYRTQYEKDPRSVNAM
jgi:hypothetical protein